MPSLCRLATGALLEAHPRKAVVFASFSHSVVLSSAALSAKPFEAPNVPEISDVFDVPVKLRERNTPDQPSKAPNILSIMREVSPHSKSVYDDPLGLPWSLPPPVIFDSPACPPHMSPSTLKKRRLQRQNLTPTPRGDHGSPVVSCSTLTSQSEVPYQLFDGPSRATRFQYPTSENEGYSFTYTFLALCLSTAFGWLALEENLEQNNERLP